MSTLLDVLSKENPGKKRQELLKSIEEEVRKQGFWGDNFCVMSLATNIYEYAVVPATYLGYPMIGQIEEHLVKFHQEGCKGLLVLLSTYGGEITFPEALISKVKDMSFDQVHVFVIDAAFSAGTLLALLSDRIVGFSNSHIGPIDPQLVVMVAPNIPKVVSAMSVKRYIEETLPKLAEEQKLGKEGLVRLYAAQDLLLYEEALKSLRYIDTVFDNRICKTVRKCEELKKLLLREVTEHSQPISLQELADIIPEKVILVDRILGLQRLAELVIQYRVLLRHFFMFERPPGGIRAVLIGSKHGEIATDVTLLTPPPASTQRAPHPQGLF